MIVNAGIFLFPINNTIIELLKLLIDKEQINFYNSFKKKIISNYGITKSK